MCEDSLCLACGAFEKAYSTDIGQHIVDGLPRSATTCSARSARKLGEDLGIGLDIRATNFATCGISGKYDSVVQANFDQVKQFAYL